jgi:sulfide:quinone oxidoreductase
MKNKKQILILGGGTAGTMMANHLAKEIDEKVWAIKVVDERENHYYQPGFLFLPFGRYEKEDIVRPIRKYLPEGVTFIQQKVDEIHSAENKITLSDGTELEYQILIIATGTDIDPGEVKGMKGEEWRKSVFDFYTFDGAMALREKLDGWEGGRLVVHITEMPIKCPVAPLEFTFLADEYFTKKNMRDKVDITYVTPLSGAFTKPRATKKLEYLLKEKKIRIESDFAIELVDNQNKTIQDYGGRVIPFDLLVTVPTNKGSKVIEDSGIGDDLAFVPTNKETLQSLVADNIFVIGDAANVPTSKAGSVAHFEAEILLENVLSYIRKESLEGKFDGHANCFVETGNGKALLIDFNYDHEPVEGTFPVPGVGPLKLLKETRMNHWGKLAFRWIYWNMLLKARPLPFVTARMSLSGKNF